ncbi:MAG: hypothetical protein IT558_00425, partial [Alphaproteobacteria bacterium]|nr:hypothetical protein [Alphaproteobacteria bacterium]
ESALTKIFAFAGSIKGGFWNYGLSSSPLHAGTPIGNFGAAVEGLPEMAMTVNRFEGEELALGHTSFNHYKERGIHVVNSLPLSGAFEFALAGPGRNDWFVHFSRHVPDMKWLAMVPDRVDGYKLGNLAGEILQAGCNLPFAQREEIREYTSATLDVLHAKGLQAFLGSSDFSALAPLLTGQEQLRESLLPVFRSALSILENNPRHANSGSLTEKTIGLMGDEYCITGYDNPGKFYQPMLGPNASYDVGMAVFRILLNQSLYSGAKEEKPSRIKNALAEFVRGYNDKTGLKLTVNESLQAAAAAYTCMTGFMAGQYVSGGKEDPYIVSELEEHLKPTLKMMAWHLQWMQNYTVPAASL